MSRRPRFVAIRVSAHNKTKKAAWLHIKFYKYLATSLTYFPITLLLSYHNYLLNINLSAYMGAKLSTTPQKPQFQAGAIVTIAFLKAQLDSENDHLGIFMPLVLDAAKTFSFQSFTAADIQEKITTIHGIVIPEHTIITLLKRGINIDYFVRDIGRYKLGKSYKFKIDITSEMHRIKEGQLRLADAFMSHCARRHLVISSQESALELLLKFIEEEQIAILLGDSTASHVPEETTIQQRAIVAEFLSNIIRNDDAYSSTLDDILAGLVLYRAAFLPDLGVKTRKFNNLKVIFDSNLIRQAIGYEGTASRTLLRETIDLLKETGIQCIVLDKSIQEIRRILNMYEDRLATSEGRLSLRPTPMTRYVLTSRLSPSDIREMKALLEEEIKSAGFQIIPVPRRISDFTSSEQALAKRLADHVTKDELEPRVLHDIDCIASVLIFRLGKSSFDIENAGAVFATSSHKVIQSIRVWWLNDERGSGFEPIVNIRALTNLAWLKQPKIRKEFKKIELLTLCTAALRPTQEVWKKFIRHLANLEKKKQITSDETAAIVISSMSDQLLHEVEIGDSNDIDAHSLDEVVDRVKESYGYKVDEVTKIYENKIKEFNDQLISANAHKDQIEQSAAEKSRRLELHLDGRARKIAHYTSWPLYWGISSMIIAGAFVVIFAHPVHVGLFGKLLAFCTILFVLMELIGLLHHGRQIFITLEQKLTNKLRIWLGGNLL